MLSVGKPLRETSHTQRKIRSTVVPFTQNGGFLKKMVCHRSEMVSGLKLHKSNNVICLMVSRDHSVKTSPWCRRYRVYSLARRGLESKKEKMEKKIDNSSVAPPTDVVLPTWARTWKISWEHGNYLNPEDKNLLSTILENSSLNWYF